MINENGEFYSQEEFERNFNLKANFLQFQGIKQAIKTYIKTSILHGFPNKTSLSNNSSKFGTFYEVKANNFT